MIDILKDYWFHLGKIGYTAYYNSTNGKTFDDRDMPLWDELPVRIKTAWSNAALAIKDESDIYNDINEG